MKMLEEYFEKDGYEQIYIHDIDNCKNKLKEYIQKNTPLFNYTDHGIEHSNRINNRLALLFEDMLVNSDGRIRLNNAELYSLILAIYLHDIGMELINKDKIIKLFSRKKYKNEFLKRLSNSISCEEINRIDENSEAFYNFIRMNHHIISAMWIMNNSILEDTLKLPIREDYLQTIALICYAHNEDFSVLKEEIYKSTQADNQNMQIDILAYLLRVGDALDADKNRCKIEILDYKNIPIESRVHWYRHFYTNSIRCENKNISILFDFPDEEEWIDAIEEYFLDETVFWINKNVEDLTSSKIFENNIRNNFLKYNIEKTINYSIKKSIDEETKKVIVDKISSKKKIIIRPNLDKYINIYEEKFNGQLIQNKYNTTTNKKLNDIFIKPRLYDYSEFEKSNDNNSKKERIDINSLIFDNKKYCIKGDECIGKTTILKYAFLKAKEADKIPFLISFDILRCDSTDLLFKELIKISKENFDDKLDIELELSQGNCIILIDDVYTNDKYYTNITEFCDSYPNNKVIITELDNQYMKIASLKDKVNQIENDNYFEMRYLHSFGIKELRGMISRWFSDSSIDSYTVFKTMREFILNNKLPRTPLVYSLFLSIIEKDSTFIPINIAFLFDKFSDIYLGKFNLFPNITGKYDYSLKQFILEELSKYMLDNNLRHLNIREYEQFIKVFSHEKGIKINSKKLLNDLVNSNFIFVYDDEVRFSFDCFMFFFYAKYIQRNNKESLLIQNIDFYKYYNAINFYSGLTLNSDEILLQSNICVMDKIEINFEKMNEYIQLYYGKEKKSEEQRFCVNKKSEEEINSELDNREKNECIIENEYDNIPDINLDDRKNDIFSSLLLLCNVLKNSDYVANELKNESLEYCLDCFSFIICNFINRMDKVVNEKFDEAEVEKENIKKDIIILITAVMQDIITSALGTTMLEEQIKNIIQSPKNILVEFLVCMISADLEINNYLNYVENLIEKVENTLLLNCVLLKLEIIFLERNYSKNTSNKNKTLKLIESILRKIYGNSFKTKDSKRNKPNSNYMLMENINNHIENLKKKKNVNESRQGNCLLANKNI
ncbi:NACHT domain-containing protein [Clostridium botulinum]|uniref:NACHT domain-containing protein n=1 Tax=Clostridium botulinum TaxID=1491 RepID=UPI003A7F9D22